jgi:hypothetical protein
MTLRHSTIVGGLALAALWSCGKGKARHDAAPAPIPRDARDAAAECASLFDRHRSTLASHLLQMGVSETDEAARQRDKPGLSTCAALSETKRACLLAGKVAPETWTSCQVEPPFTLFDATTAHEALLGKTLTPEESAAAVAALAGRWHQPARGLDDAITWTVDKTGKLTIKRVPKTGKPEEVARQLEIIRERQFAIKQGTSTQFAPFFVDGKRLYLSWTSGAIAVPVANEAELVLDLADKGRWLTWKGGTCTIVDPARGASKATCAWEGEAGAKTFVVTADTLTQRWALRSGALVHPGMELFTKQ